MPSEHIEHLSGVSPAVPEKLQFELNFKLLVLGIILLPVLLGLGFWQLERADEKKALLNAFQAQQRKAPVDLTTVGVDGLKTLPAFTRVSLRGLVVDKYWLLDNRIHRGRVGYEVLQVIATESAGYLVNRGWVEGSYDRSLAPEFAMLKGVVSISGQLAMPSKNSMLDSQPPDPQMPYRIVEIDLKLLSADAGIPLAGLIQINVESDGALVIDWPTVNITPMKHQAYAFQWFSMALALVILLAFANSNVLTVFRQQSTQNKKQ